MKKFFNRFVFEKPHFKNAPKISIATSWHCYVFPTGCGFGKSMQQLTFDPGYSTPREGAVYKYQAYMITYAYTVFFLWFRLHIEFNQRSEGMGSGFVQEFKPADKSKTTVEDILK